MTEHTQPATRSAIDVARVLRHRWWLIVMLAGLSLLPAVVFPAGLPARYAASITLVVQATNTADDQETLVRTVQALITSDVVLADLASGSGGVRGPSTIRENMKVERPPGSAVIEVSYVDSSADRARRIAVMVLPSLNQRLQRIRPSTDEPTAGLSVDSFGGEAPQLERVTVPILRNGVLGIAVGAVLGALLALVLPLPLRRRRGKAPRRRRGSPT